MSHDEVAMLLPPNRYALAIHTSSANLGLAMSNFNGEVRGQTWELGRDVSNQLQLQLEAFLSPQTWQDLEFLAVSIGPGGFTGTRIGVVTARTLAQQLEIPIFGVSSLAAIAWQTHLQSPVEDGTRIAVQMLAQRGHIYGAIYVVRAMLNDGNTMHLETSMPDAVFTEAAWLEVLNQWDCGQTIVTTEGMGDSALAMLDLAYQNWQAGDRPSWADVVPFYGLSPVS